MFTDAQSALACRCSHSKLVSCSIKAFPRGVVQAYVMEASDVDCSADSYSSSLIDQPYAAAGPDEQRWVPYRHTNGVAIYHHKESKCLVVGGGGETAAEPGSEYMASSIVRGSPDECLAVLMDMSSNTTILGPASKIELLEEADERQVRLGLPAC